MIKKCRKKLHEFTPENTYTNKKTGQIFCYSCILESQRNRRAKAKLLLGMLPTGLCLLIFIWCLNTFAGKAILTWKQDGGIPATVNEFRLTWSLDHNVTWQTIVLGYPDPISVTNNLPTWRQTLERPEWTPLSEVCFMIKALNNGVKIAQSNLACKNMPSNINAPLILNIE